MFSWLSNLFTPLVLFKVIVCAILALPTLGLSTETYSIPKTAGVTVSWDANEPAPEGYRIYKRTQEESYDYTSPCWAGPGISANVYNLDWETTYYFVVRAYDGTMESPDSEEVSCVTPISSLPPVTDPNGQIALYDFSEKSGDVVHDMSGFEEPLDLTIADPAAVQWLEGGGLAIVSPTIIRSTENAAKITTAIMASGQMSIEAWVKPTNAEQEGPARIATLSADPSYRNFTLGQQLDAYDVRCRTSGTSLNGTPSVRTHQRVENRLTHVVYTLNIQGVANIYIDGALAVTETVSGDLGNWQDYPFALANELTENRPWLGEIHLLAIFDQVLSAPVVEQKYSEGAPIIPAYTLSTTSNGNGTISPAGPITIMHGESQGFSITPDTGYRIENVQVDTQSMGPITTYQFSAVDADHSLHATFVQLTHQIVATAAEGGAITPTGSVTLVHGASQTYSISPDPGNKIEDITVDGASIGPVNTFTVDNIATSHTISATFSKITHTITIESYGNGSAAPEGQITADHGAELVITAQPEEGHEIEDVVVDGSSMGNVSSHTLTDIAKDHHVVIRFVERAEAAFSMEIGELDIDHNWMQVNLKNTYTKPIIIAGPLSTRDDAPAVVRIRNISTHSFEISVQEWDYLDGSHGNETVGYMVMEHGHHTLDNGFGVEAGTFDTLKPNRYNTISFQQTFIDPPVVTTTVATVNEIDASTGRIRNVSDSGFSYLIQEQESNRKSHAVETIHYVAWEPSSGIVGDWIYDVGTTGKTVDHKRFEIPAYNAGEDGSLILADMQTCDGGDTATVRYQKTATGIGVVVDEEQSNDDETWHLKESIGYMVFSRDPIATLDGRVIDGQIALYDFSEKSGDVVHDMSGFGEPLDLTIADPAAVQWLEGGGLAIVSPTIIRSTENAAKITTAIMASGQMSIEAWVKPANAEQEGPARIATLSADPSYRNFTLGQQLDAYDVRCRTSGTSLNGTPSVRTQQRVENRLTHVVYTLDIQGVANIYIDGALAVTETVSGDLDNWQDYPFALANELTENRPWLGEIHLLAIFDRALSTDEVLKNASLW